jgi:multiple sugar transport system substrate-binding protein
MRTGCVRRVWALAAAVPMLLAAAACGGVGGDAGTGDSAAAASCSPAASGQKVTLSFSSWVPGIEKTVALWNKQNPNIQVNFKAVPGGGSGTYQTYSNQLKAGNADDLGQIEFDTLPAFRLQGGLVNVGSCPGVAEAKSTFLDWTWSQVSFGEPGAVYAIPQDTGPTAMFYRRDLFAKANLQPPRTWDEYYTTAQKIKPAGGFVTNLDPTGGSFLAAMTWQAGGSWFKATGDGWTVDMTGGKSAQVANYWQKLLSEKLVTSYPGFTDQYYKALDSDKVWTVINASWAARLIETGATKTAGKWSVVQMPQWNAGEKAAGNLGGSTTVVFKGSKHPAEAAKFALWLNSNPQALTMNAKLGGLYPATVKGPQQVPALSQPSPFYSGEKIWSQFATASQGVPAGWTWGPTMVQTYADLSNGLGRAVQGQGTILQALASAQQKTIDAMESQGLQVQGQG